MINFFFIMVLISSCSSKQSILKQVQKSDVISIKTIPVESKQEAKKYIQNQRNFLVLLFEQSRDPYYGTPKWNEQCLKDNKIGEVVESQEYILLTSKLFFDAKGKPGFCIEQRPLYGQHIILYCHGKNEVLDLKFNSSTDLDLKQYQLCDHRK